MRRENTLSAFAPSLLMQAAGIAFSYAAVGIEGAAIASAAAPPISFMLFISQRRLIKRRVEQSEERELIVALASIYADSTARNLSLGAAITNAMRKIDSASCTRRAFEDVLRSVRSGSDVHEALMSASSSMSKAVSKTIRSLSAEYERRQDSIQAVRSEYERIEANAAVADEKAAGAQQRNLTISMAASTVIPSFALFGFVGYSIINYSATKLSLFAALMLVVIPGMYSMIRNISRA